MARRATKSSCPGSGVSTYPSCHRSAVSRSIPLLAKYDVTLSRLAEYKSTAFATYSRRFFVGSFKVCPLDVSNDIDTIPTKATRVALEPLVCVVHRGRRIPVVVERATHLLPTRPDRVRQRGAHVFEDLPDIELRYRVELVHGIHMCTVHRTTCIGRGASRPRTQPLRCSGRAFRAGRRLTGSCVHAPDSHPHQLPSSVSLPHPPGQGHPFTSPPDT